MGEWESGRGRAYLQRLDLIGEDHGHGNSVLVTDRFLDQGVELGLVAHDEDGGNVVGIEQGLLGSRASPLGLIRVVSKSNTS